MRKADTIHLVAVENCLFTLVLRERSCFEEGGGEWDTMGREGVVRGEGGEEGENLGKVGGDVEVRGVWVRGEEAPWVTSACEGKGCNTYSSM